ncbi:histidine kinase [Clostridium folliculivorans]|uniref:histidine kinase n=2 Tax=Clostridium folliculivorans TaxID=2886038 RepID=A0A9W5Y512_9CLOT|nr:histidine kinase [Clostridium folliculivorans]GKU28908.1 histidine kinase [Clostridium folliculivorans]
MRNMFKSTFTPDSDETIFPKTPIVVGIILIYLSTVFVPNSHNLHLNEVIGITIVMMIQLFVFWFSSNIFKNKYWLYFVIQGIITFDYAIIAPEAYKTIVLGLTPLFIIQSMIVYTNAIKVVGIAISFYSIFSCTIIILNGVRELVQSFPLLIVITIAMRAYSIIFFNQVKLRIQSQKVSQELALAYEKVEELTLINERQRVARDLHDTLSQGIAGTIMQLDAVNANLNNNNVKRAQEIVQKAMEHARKTLADSRLVIDDLRAQTNKKMGLKEALEKEISSFKGMSSTSITSSFILDYDISENISKHILYVVREGLNNIARHAEAENAVIEVRENEHQINISISDDGIGFDVKLLDRLFGHYGIIGMTERVKAIKGKIKIKSRRKAGTNINIIIPIEKGITDENE